MEINNGDSSLIRPTRQYERDPALYIHAHANQLNSRDNGRKCKVKCVKDGCDGSA